MRRIRWAALGLAVLAVARPVVRGVRTLVGRGGDTGFDRRAGRDRRSGADRRAAAGEPPARVERRSGAERRSGRDRRSST